ncbi:DEP domain-containing protein 1A isoform X1 [Osmerus eperlanus]|uniref:DEP domain-containing protein 1A isoform X1 n=1 Tax=Osmerus eperlanus TaxID=29151 RepID=UPI002E0E7BB6
MSTHIITPGPYRATKLWNEVTKLFRAGMPLRKHRLHFRVHGSCFTAAAAVDWLHELLRNNSNFGPDVTRQQTLQLLKKFLKNHVIEDVKGRWGTEELEDDGHIYRFPPSSPLKPLPRTPSGKKNFSLKDKEGFFKFRSSKKLDKETLENVDPSEQEQEVNGEAGTVEVHRRELTNDDVLEVWRDITLTHLQKILGVTALEDVLDLRHVNPQNIVYNMTNVNKHGVVTLEDKTDDIPPWVLSAMKCLASWPKSDSSHPSYPGFERDVFKTVSDYFNSLPQPLLTFEFYELFINVLVLSGYLVAPKPQRGKRKSQEPAPSHAPPAKTPHVGVANLFRSTECLLLSLLRKEACDETDSPMKEVFGPKVRSRLAALRGGVARQASQHAPPTRRVSSRAALLGGSCLSLAQSESSTASLRLRPRSCSMETILDDSAPLCSQRELFQSTDMLASCHSNSNQGNNTSSQTSPDSCQGNDTPSQNTPDSCQGNETPSQNTPDSCRGNDASSQSTPGSRQSSDSPAQSSPDSLSESQSQISVASATSSNPSHSRHSLSLVPTATVSISHRPRPQRPRSVGNCLDLIESREMSASCFSIHAPVAEITLRPKLAHGYYGLRASITDLRPSLILPPGDRRCLSSLDLTRPGPSRPAPFTLGPQPLTRPRTSSLGPQPLTRPRTSSLGPQPLSRPPSSLGPQPLTRPRTSSLGPQPLTRPPPSSLGPQPLTRPDNSLLQPQLERVAVEALQLCCLLLPPGQRRKLQLLMRMMSRMSQNVDMPRLHQAIGTRTLMVHSFSGCVLSCAEEVDLDELLATRLVSFLLDHHTDILSVPLYLHHAVTDHLHYLRTVQIPYPVGAGVPGSAGGVPVPLHAFCRQISSQEFEEQRLTMSQTAIAELLDLLLADSSLAGKERRKKLRQFQKQYPDIFSRRFPSPESQAQILEDKPRIKPPLLLTKKIRKNIRT